jgi:DNA-binding NarL/FixJ family response regulator
MKPISIVVVEDHLQYRQAIVRLVAAKPDVICLGMFPSAEEALKKIPGILNPDIILMDINLPRMTGVEAVKILQQTAPHIEILMLTIHEDSHSVFEALQAGANGYLVKTSPQEEIYDGIVDIASGGSPMSDGIARKVLRTLRTPSQTLPHETTSNTPLPLTMVEEYALTRREEEILQFLVRGYQYKEIATEIFLSSETVRKHIHNIYRKLQVHSRAEAMIKMGKL